jgi:hypothetical protein
VTHNVIVLSPGLSGSSVVTALIARAGYWTGDDTKKISYDTFENATLVDLNKKLLRAAGHLGDGAPANYPPTPTDIENSSQSLNMAQFISFLERCESEQPWIWKDPRLCFTMDFWAKLVDISSCRFIVVTRDVRQAWTGLVLRKLPPTPMHEMGQIFQMTIARAHAFLERNGLGYLQIRFEDLICQPDQAIESLVGFLGVDLRRRDLEAVYCGNLQRRRWSRSDYIAARLRFLVKFALRDVHHPTKNTSRSLGRIRCSDC